MTTLARWDPFRDLMSIQGEMNRLFGRTFTGGEDVFAGSWAPALDIYETDQKFVVSVELPGIEPEDVDVSVEDSTLTIRGERKFSDEVNEESYHRVERRYGSFVRSFGLPRTVDTDKIEASYDKGVLTVEVPKVEAPKPKKIAVKAEA